MESTAIKNDIELEDEMIDVIIERERKAEQNSDIWVDASDVFTELEKKLNATI